MVDINLFKEEEEEEWKPDSEGGESLNDDLGDDLNLGDDIEEPSPLDDEKLLGDEEAIPDFEEPDEAELEEDYEYGEGTARKAPIWLWAILGVVIVAAAFYLFWYQPRQKKKAASPSVTLLRQPQSDSLATAAQRTGGTTTSADEDTLAGGTEADREPPPPIATGTIPAGVPGSTIRYVDAAKPVFENLSSQGQLGTIILEGNRFHVGYVSANPGLSQTIGQRIQRMIGASAIKVSPEDRHRTAGKVQYWGVISGDLPQRNYPEIQTSAQRFASVDRFVQGMRGLVQQSGLTLQESETFSARSEGGIRKTPIRVKVEGKNANAVSFLDVLKGFQGAYDLTKLTIAPVDISDFQASQVKLALDFSVWTG